MHEILGVVIALLDIYQWLLLAVVLLSWINPDPYNPIVRFLRAVTDPVLLPFRRLMMPLTMRLRIDFSPILAFLLIGIMQRVLQRIRFGGLSAGAVAWSIVDGLIVFVAAVALFLFIFLLARAVVDATGADRWNPIVRFITMVTDPIVYRFHRVKLGRSRFDFRPVAAAGVSLVAYMLLQTLRSMLP
jgi:YggT family protein